MQATEAPAPVTAPVVEQAAEPVVEQVATPNSVSYEIWENE